MSAHMHPVWQPLIDGLLEAVWVVEPRGLRIESANAAAGQLLGVDPSSLVGRPVIDYAATPEDQYFWEDVAAGVDDAIRSDSFVLRADGTLVPVERRVSRVWVRPGQSVFLVAMLDLSAQRRVEDELEKLVAELRATLESTADGILVTDLSGAIRGCNRHFATLWGLPEERLQERDDAAIHAWMREQVIDATAYDERLLVIDREPLLRGRDTLVLRSGRVLERLTLPQYGRGQPVGRVYSFRDITQQLASESRLRLAASVFECSLDAIFVTGPDHRIIAANASCERVSGLTREALAQRSTQDLLYRPDHEGEWFAPIEAALADSGVWEGELWHRHASGESRPGQVSLVRLKDEHGATLHHIGFFKDLTETVAAQKRIEELAFNDALTGLPNRVMLTERIEFSIAMSQRDRSRFALLFIDLDRFKHINDSLGHQYGDRVLVEVARRLQGCVRQVDTVARLSGDEFVMLVHQADVRGAEATARRALEALSQPFELDAMSFSVTASIGIALFPTDGGSMSELIKNADAAMYRVKERGRAGFRFYQPQMNVDLLARMKLDHAMRQALARQDFKLHYQPQVEMATQRVVGVEALLRWSDADLGDISPGEFIPVAEETGFIVALGEWVLGEAVRQASLWQAQGRDLVVSVNVSALQFQQADFVDRVAAALTRAQLRPDRLELELTESILIRDADEALARLRLLDRLGVRLAIDDFGTGYSSLGYLKRFPIRKLKIDRSFVKGLPGDESDAGIASAIIQLARALRLRVIAEGVETLRQREFLREAGCDEFQGWLFAAALAPQAVERLLDGVPKLVSA